MGVDRTKGVDVASRLASVHIEVEAIVEPPATRLLDKLEQAGLGGLGRRKWNDTVVEVVLLVQLERPVD